MYQVEIRSCAEKEIEALPSTVSRRLLETIANLGTEPRPNGARKLAADGGYRVRVGDYRIVYEMMLHRPSPSPAFATDETCIAVSEPNIQSQTALGCNVTSRPSALER